MIDLLEERHQQEDRLRKLGYDVDGGGIGFGSWEIFVYLYPNGEEKCYILDGVGDVDKFIAEHPLESK